MTRCSSSPEQKEGEGRGLEIEKDPHQGQMINKVATAVMKKLAESGPTKILTRDYMNRIKQCLSEVYPVFRPPNHPTYAVMIQMAIDELDEDGGSTQESISKFIRERFDCLPLAHESLLGHHLKKLSDSREIVSASKHSGMLPAEKKYKNCDKLPAGKKNSVSQREQVQKGRRRKLARGRRKNSRLAHQKVAEEQVEETEQQRKYGHETREPNQEERKHEQDDEVNGQQGQKKMQQVAMFVSKQKCIVSEEQVGHWTEQPREHGQQSQEPNLQEQRNKVIDEHDNKVAEENFEAWEDETGEEQCQTKDQQCEVAREQLQIEGIESEIQLLEEQKQTEPKQQIEMISEQNEPEEQIESISKIIDSGSMQELLSKKHEKDAASLTCQLLPQHGSSCLSEENCVELLMRTRKLQVKLLENLSSIRERSNNSVQNPKLQPIELSSSLELPTKVFSKLVSLGNHGRQRQMPKCKNKSIKTFHDVDLSPQQEVGFLERSLELLTSEAENGEVSWHIGQRTCLNFEAKNVREKHLEVQNVEAHESEPNITNSSVDLLQESQESDAKLIIQEKSQGLEHSMQSFGQEKQQQISLFDEVKRPDGEVATNEEQQAENAIRETPVEIELAESEQSCKKQQVKQEQQNQRQLHPRHKKPSESGCGEPKPTKFQKLEPENLPENPIEESLVELGTEAPDQSCQTPHKTLGQQQKRQLRPRGKISLTRSQKELEHNQQHRERLHEIGMTLDPLPAKLSCQAQKNTQEPAYRRLLRPRGERQSISEVSITTSTAESQPTRHHATLLPTFQEAEKPQEMKISSEKMGQTQQRRQLRTQVKKLSESEEAPTGSGAGVSPSQYQELSNSGRSQLGKVGERQAKSEVSVSTSMVESPPTRHQLPDLQEAEKPQELKTSAVKGGQTQHQRQLRSRVEKPSESGQSSSGCRAVLSPSQSPLLSNSGRSQMQEPRMEDSSPVKNQNKNHYNLRKRCTSEPTTMDGLSEFMEQKLIHQGQQKKSKSRPTTTEVPDELAPSVTAESSVKELQRQRHMTLRSHGQGVSQSDPSASMTESSPLQDQCQKPEEREHRDELQQKQKKPHRPKNNFETTLVNTDIQKWSFSS